MTDRRYDLDWLRIGAFALLILYHVRHVLRDLGLAREIEPGQRGDRAADAADQSLAADPALPHFRRGDPLHGRQAERRAHSPGARMGRLWPPLLLAVFVIVPPQTYYEIVEAMQAMPAAPRRPVPARARQFLRQIRHRLRQLVRRRRLPDHADLQPHVVRRLPHPLHAGADPAAAAAAPRARRRSAG